MNDLPKIRELSDHDVYSCDSVLSSALIFFAFAPQLQKAFLVTTFCSNNKVYVPHATVTLTMSTSHQL